MSSYSFGLRRRKSPENVTLAWASSKVTENSLSLAFIRVRPSGSVGPGPSLAPVAASLRHRSIGEREARHGAQRDPLLVGRDRGELPPEARLVVAHHRDEA